MINKTYNCPAAQKHVDVLIKKDVLNQNHGSLCSQPESCSSIGECRCGVVQILFGMTYAVDWKKCQLYSQITEQ
jgi:hypothetical protein